MSDASNGTQSENSTFWLPASKVGVDDIEFTPGQVSQAMVVRSNMGFNVYGTDIDVDGYQGQDLLGSFATDRKWFRHEYRQRNGTEKAKKYIFSEIGNSVTVDFIEEPSEPLDAQEKQTKFFKQGFRVNMSDGVQREKQLVSDQ